jgi:molybdopterin/thiamine biosynthesis adenylyltransferase
MRIQNARVLVCGLRGLHIEVVKNVVLAGMNIVIQDSATVCMQDLSHNFFVSAADVGRNVRSTYSDDVALQNF